MAMRKLAILHSMSLGFALCLSAAASAESVANQADHGAAACRACYAGCSLKESNPDAYTTIYSCNCVLVPKEQAKTIQACVKKAGFGDGQVGANGLSASVKKATPAAPKAPLKTK